MNFVRPHYTEIMLTIIAVLLVIVVLQQAHFDPFPHQRTQAAQNQQHER